MGHVGTGRYGGFYARVVVLSCSPNYYAAGVMNTGFELTGQFFELIPNDAIGVFAKNNSNPLQYINSTYAPMIYDIVSRGTGRMTLLCREANTGHEANFLGAIISADRQTVYWENSTNPLP